MAAQAEPEADAREPPAATAGFASKVSDRRHFRASPKASIWSA
jgi:hypothetical protein